MRSRLLHPKVTLKLDPWDSTQSAGEGFSGAAQNSKPPKLKLRRKSNFRSPRFPRFAPDKQSGKIIGFSFADNKSRARHTRYEDALNFSVLRICYVTIFSDKLYHRLKLNVGLMF